MPMYNIPDPATVRREIEASYERCKQYGVNPEDTRNPRQKRLTAEQLARRLELNQEFLSIAAALVLEPKLVIADEPLSMLDVSIRAGILDLIRELSARMNFTCIYVSHDLSILSNISERLMIMYLGRMMELAPTKDVITDPLHPYAKALISAVAIPDPAYKRPVPDIRGEVSQPIDPPPGCRFQTRCKQVMDVCLTVDPPLKEVKPGHFAACHLY